MSREPQFIKAKRMRNPVKHAHNRQSDIDIIRGFLKNIFLCYLSSCRPNVAECPEQKEKEFKSMCGV